MGRVNSWIVKGDYFYPSLNIIIFQGTFMEQFYFIKGIDMLNLKKIILPETFKNLMEHFLFVQDSDSKYIVAAFHWSLVGFCFSVE